MRKSFTRVRAFAIAIMLDVLPVLLGALVLYSALAVFVNAHAYTGTAMLVREVELDNWTKVCVYERLGKTYTLTIPSLRWCPVTIQVEV